MFLSMLSDFKEEHIWRVPENRVLRRIFALKRQQVTGLDRA
jgi:hypothetical protein